MPRCKRQAGQSTVEYVGAVLLIALVLVGAATAVAAPDIPRSVVSTIRTGICIVAGDVCRPADAAARGLDPCVVSTWDRSRRSGFTIGVLHIGGTDDWTIMRRSDGTRLLTYAPGFGVSASTGASLSLGPRLKVGVDASGGIEFAAGKAWELPDEAALQRLIKRIDARYAKAKTPWGKLGTPAAPISFIQGGMPIDASAEVTHPATTVADGAVSANKVLGRRSGPDGTTWYYHAGGRTSATLLGELPVLPGASGDVVLEWHRGPSPSLTLRSTVVGHGRATETVARLGLGRADDARLVASWLLHQTAPGFSALTAKDIARRLAARGTVERFTYADDQDSDGWDYSAKAGAGVGIDRETTLVQRRLVGAEVIQDGRSATRYDCLDAA